ncbi:IQ calmodulin-binding motif-containing protein 1 isoform X2 [Fundulus heteroclitus]|uniref:IQ calmodulin-binding motif-containing protein 1 isoform X2 n=1 Tax=Fundulus heteroclitus TaxID=8078 RepID=UPI00165BB58D|nr:IQ calmodulin-binding motif-containing protein 1 isoform X2 [Fundulus heteroclitus]
MELLEEEEAAIPELKRQLETEDLGPEEKISLLNDALNKVLNSAAVQADSAALTRVKSQLYLSGVLGQCVRVLPLGRNWTSAATLAHLTSCSCVGAEPGSRSEAFHRLFLPSVMDALLSLANQLMSRAECSALFRKVMDSVGWLLSAHTHLTDQVLSSVRYEQIQMCEDVTVSLLCIQMWIQTCTVNRDFLSRLSDESVLLLLNEAVGQLALSSDSAVGGASVRLMLLMARQLGLRLQSLLLNFKGLDSLLEKDWTGRGFDQEVGQLISILQRDGAGSSESEVSAERLRAACLIQAAWRSYRTRRRVKGLNRAVSTLQRRYRARRRRLQEQREAQQWEEQLSYQVCVRRQRARRRFHQKQRELLLLLPPDQVRPYLQECERRAAVAIQSAWRGFRERRRYKGAPGDALRESQRRQRAARTLQRAGRRLLEKRRAAKAPPLTPPWIGQDGLTESRRAELKQQVDEHVAVHRSTRVSAEECAALHEEVQLLLRAELQKVAQRRREEQRVEALLACARTQLELLREAPPLSTVTVKQAESFLSPSASIAARARDAHNAALQASRLPWWRTLGGMDTGEEVGPAHLQELEAELGGLFIGGSAVVRGGAEVDGAKL